MQITTEADVIACYISLLLADVIVNVFVADVLTTIPLRLMFLPVILPYCWLMLLPKQYVVDVMSTYCNMRRCYLANVIAHICLW